MEGGGVSGLIDGGERGRGAHSTVHKENISKKKKHTRNSKSLVESNQIKSNQIKSNQIKSHFPYFS